MNNPAVVRRALRRLGMRKSTAAIRPLLDLIADPRVPAKELEQTLLQIASEKEGLATIVRDLRSDVKWMVETFGRLDGLDDRDLLMQVVFPTDNSRLGASLDELLTLEDVGVAPEGGSVRMLKAAYRIFMQLWQRRNRSVTAVLGRVHDSYDRLLPLMALIDGGLVGTIEPNEARDVARELMAESRWVFRRVGVRLLTAVPVDRALVSEEIMDVLVGDPHPAVAIEAIRAVATGGGGDEEIVRGVAGRLGEWYGAEAVAALERLSEGGGEPARVVDVLFDVSENEIAAVAEHWDQLGFDDESPSRARTQVERVVEVLVDLGKPVIPALMRHLDVRDADDFIAVWALAEIGAPPHCVPTLCRLLEDERFYVAPRAARALGRMGDEGVAALPALMKAVGQKGHPFRLAALRAAGDIGVKDTTYLPVLVGALADKNAGVQEAAIRTIGFMGARAASVAPVLERLARSSESEEVRRAAAYTLRQIVVREE